MRVSKQLGSSWLVWKRFIALLLLGLGSSLLGAQPALPPAPDTFSGHPRLVIISDIGNEPDDQMSFVRLLLYSNELDLEAMIASTSTWQRKATHPETMHAIVQVYGKVRPNLLLHAEGWPTAEELDQRVFAGQPAYGLAATGQGKASAGSKVLVKAIERDDPRPLWVCLWGGANTLAQALVDLRASHSQVDVDRMVTRLRVSAISDQDDAGPWIRREFPSLPYIVKPSPPNSEEYSYATWTGISGDIYYRNGTGADASLISNEWLETNIRAKGPLGRMYPKFMFIMEGDTPSYLGLIDNGLNAYRRPDWGGWGGRYVYRQPYGETHSIWTQGGDEFARATSQDSVIGVDGVEHVSDQATIWRWREAFQNDFAARMDWTVQDFAHANHNPLVVLNGIAGRTPIEMEMNADQTVTHDATGTSDPDGQALTYKWFVYSEAGLTGIRGAEVTLVDDDKSIAKVKAISTCRPTWLQLAGKPYKCRSSGVVHIILAVTDSGSPRLTAYRRVILTVNPADLTPN
jgi:hypothetical protein